MAYVKNGKNGKNTTKNEKNEEFEKYIEKHKDGFPISWEWAYDVSMARAQRKERKGEDARRMWEKAALEAYTYVLTCVYTADEDDDDPIDHPEKGVADLTYILREKLGLDVETDPNQPEKVVEDLKEIMGTIYTRVPAEA